MTFAGHHYAGNQNRTTSGRSCQAWNSHSPHYNYYTGNTYFPEGNATLAGSRCRNPDYNWHGGLWCYTTDAAKRWESCSEVPYCSLYTSLFYIFSSKLTKSERDQMLNRSILQCGYNLFTNSFHTTVT